MALLAITSIILDHLKTSVSSPQLRDIFAGYKTPDWKSPFLSTSEVLLHCHLTILLLMKISPSLFICIHVVSSSFVAYKNFLFILSFQQFGHDVSQCYLASFLLLEIHWVYWILEWIFLIKFESCIVISSSNIFSLSSPHSLTSWGCSHTDFISVSQTGQALSYLEILTLDFLST